MNTWLNRMFDMTTPTFKYSLAGLVVLTILLSRIGSLHRAPVLLLIHRWLRWILFAGVFSYLLRVFEFSLRPDWVHFTTGLALWFLCETGYNWIAINALSRSDIPLFPRFKANKADDEWPEDGHLSKLQDWLSRQHFKRLSVLEAPLFEDLVLRAFVYESPDRMTRIQMLLAPGRRKAVSVFYTLCTNGPDDHRLITDNYSLPFGGYYPENWVVARKPLAGSPEKLFRCHEARLSRVGFESVPFENEPLDDLNEQQNLLERLNVKRGVLNPLQFREQSGRLTFDGRYRLWKEMWLLAYFGRAIH